MNFPIARFAVIAASVCLVACAGESVSEPSTPDVQSRSLGQLSAGGGIAGYDFYANLGGVYTRIGSLLVVEDGSDPSQGYYDETEYWRFDQAALDEVATGSVSQVSIDFLGQSPSYDQKLVDKFEDGSASFTAWTVNRLFDLATEPTTVYNQPSTGQILYSMEGKGWGLAAGKRITYYLEMDYAGGAAFPHMTWYIDYEDFAAWTVSRGDDKRIYEVRLSQKSTLVQTDEGLGYELKTLK